MANIRLIPSDYTSSHSSYASVYSGEANMYNNTDHTSNYASLRGRNSSTTTAYYIFLKPLLYLAMILICYFYLKKFYKNLLEKKVPLSIFSMTIFLVSLFFPAIVESLYVINSSIAIVLILSILFILFSIFLVYTNKILKKE